jgi:TonB family protein
VNFKLQLLRRALSLTAVAVVLIPISAIADLQMKGLGCVAEVGGLYFAPEAIRLNKDGAVLVEYSVNLKGMTERVVVLKSSAAKPLERSAVRLVRNLRCKPGADWQQTNGPLRRLRLNVLFQFNGRQPVSPIDPAEEVITVSADPI